MFECTLKVEAATPASVAPYGHFIGTDTTRPCFAEWPGVTVYGKVPITVGSGGEVLHVRMDATAFPARIAILERHFAHTQTYLPANGRPFVMVLGLEVEDGLPKFPALRAFRFTDGAGIAMHAGTWHEFPLALENDTRFTVILREESHVNLLESPPHPWDARGPDLERFDITPRARLFVQL
jgi:ureidoglycolate lyase